MIETFYLRRMLPSEIYQDMFNTLHDNALSYVRVKGQVQEFNRGIGSANDERGDLTLSWTWSRNIEDCKLQLTRS